jgi:hypothetical protein
MMKNYWRDEALDYVRRVSEDETAWAVGEGPRPDEGFVPSPILLLRDALRLAEAEHAADMEARRLTS